MCIRCNSKQETNLIINKGFLCDKCYKAWEKLYYSTSRGFRLDGNIFSEGGLWDKFMREMKQEVVVFT